MPPKVKFERESIINAAFEIVRKKSWKGLSARSIAQELNSSTEPIYSHLKSMEIIEEEIFKRAWLLFEKYMTASVTGDKWIDQGIGHLQFAKEEGALYTAIFDGTHHTVPSEFGQTIFKKLGDQLSDYPLFKGLPKETQFEIRTSRMIFNHGIASFITQSRDTNGDLPGEDITDEDRIQHMKRISMVIFNGVTNMPPASENDFFDGKAKAD